MSEPKFTPGPWEAESARMVEPYPGAGYKKKNIRVFSMGNVKKRCICTICHGVEFRKKHDAALIAEVSK